MLEEAEVYLAASSLVYIYAELRQLSYCGFTRTKFDDIDCNQSSKSITAFKLLQVILHERDWLIDKKVDPPVGEEWRSDIL